jgi:LacI family transcriptional regulator, galactose operon repressor
MRDVARVAGVSQTTVSFVINDVPEVHISQATRDRVWAAVTRLGYRPNAIARDLRRDATDTIGFVLDEAATAPSTGRMIQGAQEAAWEQGKLLLLVGTGGDPAVEARALAMLVDRRVDGIVYATVQRRVVEPGRQLREVPAVLLDAEAADASLPSVVPDDESAAVAATSVMLDAGRRRIAFLNSSDPTTAVSRRLAGYRRALEARGVPFDDGLVRAGGYRAAHALLGSEDAPTGLLCFDDQIAMGAYQALADRNLEVPDDAAVVGFDDHALIAPYLRPRLSTFALPHYEMGRWAVEHLIDLIEGSSTDRTVVQHRLPCRYVARESV